MADTIVNKPIIELEPDLKVRPDSLIIDVSAIKVIVIADIMMNSNRFQSDANLDVIA